MQFSSLIKQDKIQKFYTIDDTPLGTGGFGVVKKGYSKVDNHPYAIKIYMKNAMESDDELGLENEVIIMSQTNHPNIVKLYQVYEDKDKYCLVLELMTGGELFDRIVEKVHYSEAEARQVILPVIDAVRYLHEMGIVHRDLKPQNILYDTDKDNATIKLSDFGVSKIITNEKMSTQVGTPSYFAPEVLIGNGYNNSVDYWSIGVILYILLCGYPPFSEDSNQVLYEKIKRGEYDFPAQDWGSVSEDAKDLVKKLLVVNSNQRYKANEIMNHPWVRQDNISNSHLKQACSNIKSYNTLRKMKRAKNAVGFVHHLNMLRREKSPGK